MNIFHEKFSTGQVVEATGVSNDTLQNWLKRKLIVGQKDIDGGGSQGRHRQFTFFNLIEIAAAKALIDVGMTDLKAAFYAASRFSHSGDEARVPGCPFNKGYGITLLVAGQGWAREVFLSENETALDFYTQNIQSSAVGATIVNMSRVFDLVTTRAGFHPEAVLEIAYPKDAED
ncbi:MerR family transcriptional regulator [Gemmobacter sp. 24YEA27]|uniref:MerR family transcriptional regulator n=1 Tax=Gemmobacter sp. 24YEA27 TaxID=3040672 RepID=UPI0024B3733A|nr:MerR family transcriptional regulator [Gemmobacter sp. 24YEA27]